MYQKNSVSLWFLLKATAKQDKHECILCVRAFPGALHKQAHCLPTCPAPTDGQAVFHIDYFCWMYLVEFNIFS